LVCMFCGKDFYPKGGHLKQKTCSKECGYKYRASKPNPKKGKHYPHLQKAAVKICPTCEGEFRAVGDTFRRKQKYCSKECWSKRGKTLFQRTCPHCLKEFKTRYKRKRFCSKACSLSVHQGEKSHFWKGGKTKKITIQRTNAAYKEWRKKVFERDNYTCQECGARSEKGKRINLDPHHLKPVSDYPELIQVIENGITLCRECHKKTDTYGPKQRWARAKRIK